MAFVMSSVVLVTLILKIVVFPLDVHLIDQTFVPVNSAPMPVAPIIVGPDNYVFYPNYGVYYNSSRHQYNYIRNKAWVSQPNPYGVSINTLQASPSVKMDFHDSPAMHDAEMVHKYPHNWAPPGGQQDKK